MEKQILKVGRLRGDKIKYEDGVGYCVWYPFPRDSEDDDESSGICFDFAEKDIDDLIQLLQQLKEAEPELYNE